MSNFSICDGWEKAHGSRAGSSSSLQLVCPHTDLGHRSQAGGPFLLALIKVVQRAQELGHAAPRSNSTCASIRLAHHTARSGARRYPHAGLFAFAVPKSVIGRDASCRGRASRPATPQAILPQRSHGRRRWGFFARAAGKISGPQGDAAPRFSMAGSAREEQLPDARMPQVYPSVAITD